MKIGQVAFLMLQGREVRLAHSASGQGLVFGDCKSSFPFYTHPSVPSSEALCIHKVNHAVAQARCDYSSGSWGWWPLAICSQKGSGVRVQSNASLCGSHICLPSSRFRVHLPNFNWHFLHTFTWGFILGCYSALLGSLGTPGNCTPWEQPSTHDN